MLDMYKYSVTLKAYILKTARHVPYIWVADGQRNKYLTSDFCGDGVGGGGGRG